MEKVQSEIITKENRVVFNLNSKIYSLEAIYSTAYTFIDKCYIHLDGDPKREIVVSLKGKKKLTKDQLNSLEGEFKNELLNYLLRVEIAERNKKVRDFIVGTALVSAFPSELLSESSEFNTPEIPDVEGWEDDPLGIGQSWEEKQGSQKTIESLNLSSKVENNLKKAGLDTIKKIKEANKDDLLAIDGVGEKSVEEILDKLLEYIENEN